MERRFEGTLVTGAASGIGAARFAAEGATCRSLDVAGPRPPVDATDGAAGRTDFLRIAERLAPRENP